MAKHEHNISLLTAIFININIMLGAGIFINTTVLAQYAGVLGALSYIIIGTLMLPLVVSIARLLSLHPAGGFYIFASKEINPFAGFMSAWAYFTGKLASATLMIHTAILLIQQIIPQFAVVNTLFADAIILSLFIGLNMLNVRTGGNIQILFVVFKTVPILFLFLTAIFLLNGAHFGPVHQIWSGIPSTLPLVLYATIGFEAACSLSSKIHDAKKNAPKAVLISYGAVILIASLYQLLFYGVHGDLFATFSDFRNPFPALLDALLPHNAHLGDVISGILHLGIAVSALGGSYGIIYSNNWNLHTLAQHGHTFAPSWLKQFNKHQIPWMCVIIEGLIIALYFVMTRGSQLTLQQLGALGCVLAFTISVLSLIYAKKNARETKMSWWIPLLAFGNCLLLITSCVYSLIYSGASSLITFGLLLAFGAFMFFKTPGQPSAQLESDQSEQA